MADFVILKYSPSGSQIWVARYANSGYDWPFTIQLDSSGCIYVAGNLGAPSFSDMGIIKYCQNGVGIETPPEEINAITLFPNPTSEQFTVITESQELPASLHVYNSIGQLVFQSTLLAIPETINTNLPDGSYFVQIISETTISTVKLCVSNSNR